MDVKELFRRLREINDQVNKSPGPALIAPMGDEFAKALHMANALQRELHDEGDVDVIIQFLPTFNQFSIRNP